MSSVWLTAAGAFGASPFLFLDVATRMGLSYRTSELTGGIMVKPPLAPLNFEPLTERLARCLVCASDLHPFARTGSPLAAMRDIT